MTRLPILTFHDFAPTPSLLSFPPALFRRGIARLAGKGYRSLDLLEAAEAVRVGAPLPDKSFVITIDDGYESVFLEAYPILREYGMTATVFVTTGEGLDRQVSDRIPSLEGRSMLHWNQLRELLDAGFSVGAHTQTHPDLTREAPHMAEQEILNSKTILEDRLGIGIDCFAYPFGKYDARTRDLVAQHFTCACSDRLGMLRHTSDLHATPRVETYYLQQPWVFDLLSTPLLSPYLSLRNVPRRARRAMMGT